MATVRRGSGLGVRGPITSVFADSDALKSVSVMAGDSVTLQTNTEIQTDDVITWTFGHTESRIAKVDKWIKRLFMYDVLDGRFRDRLRLDHQTGSLTITNTRTTHSRLYQVIINGTTDIIYRFNITVSEDKDATRKSVATEQQNMNAMHKVSR
ncbi:ATP-dependent RNA helicase DBP4 [Labeo rohita]|uniref:ATP-dependent RNA helicase DBP4 n=1 Tax=Labeo rohita TaxID=84645 RepID=A0ABQ8L482_LABRO|nr:ATP-dependent RNA helicase DBP4 [Labeo rohita]